MAIEKSLNNGLKQVDLNSRKGVNGGGYGGGSYARLNVISHKCGKKGHLQKYCNFKGNGYGENPSQKPLDELT